jgi:septum formation protein
MNLSHPLILASNSPRRQAILKDAGFQFQILVREVAEDYPDHIRSENVAEYLALKKNQAYQDLAVNHIVVTSDTTVILDDEILGKPADEAEAIAMLQKLSGKQHDVITGVCITHAEHLISFSAKSTIVFKPLSTEEIMRYVTDFKPYDKAGSYGIQERIGLIGISRLEGSYFNVVGLPIDRVYEELMRFRVG